MSMDRRQFVTRGAGLTAGLWIAPQIQNVAFAQAPAGSPPMACCTADATGLIVRSQLLGINEEIDNLASANINAGALGNTVAVTANVVSSSASAPDGGPCRATASVTDLAVDTTGATDLVLRASVLSSQADASCAPGCGTSGSSVITIESLVVGGVDQTALVTAGCNSSLLGIVFLNEQTCSGEELTVNALRIDLGNLLQLVVSQSQAGADGCSCTPCA